MVAGPQRKGDVAADSAALLARDGARREPEQDVCDARRCRHHDDRRSRPALHDCHRVSVGLRCRPATRRRTCGPRRLSCWRPSAGKEISYEVVSVHVPLRFRCVAGCAGVTRSTRSSTAARPAAACSRCVHDLEALQTRSAAAWMQLFDERYRRTTLAVRLRRVGQEGVGRCPHIDDENIVSMYEGGTNLFWAERYGKTLGLDDLWVKLCGNSHTGSFKDLGMTVLVVGGQADDRATASRSAPSPAPRPATPRPRSPPTRAAAGHPRGGAPAARQDLDRAARPAARQRRARARARHRLRRLHGDRAASSPRRSGVYLANSMNSLRIEGQKTVAIEIVQQFDWEVPDWVDHPGRQPRQRVARSAPGFEMMLELGLIQQAAAHLRGPGRSAPTRSTAPTSAASTTFEPITRADRRWPRRSRSATRSASSGRSARCSAFDGVVEQATEEELADAAAARRPHRHVHLPAHRRGARRAREAGRARRDPRERARGRGLAPPTASSSPTSRCATTRARCPRSPKPARQPPGRAPQRLRRRPRSCPPSARFVKGGRG